MPTPTPSKSLVFVEDVVAPIAHAAEAMALARRVSFRWRVDSDLPGVSGDERALQEALSNLVDNALKYVGSARSAAESVRRPMVIMRGRLSTDADGWEEGAGAVIEVCDNGPGIPAHELDRIFERGYRGEHPLKSEVPGTGLGLGIARDIVRHMGGDIRITRMDPSSGWSTCASLFLPRLHRNLR
ncbi:unnamed protein product [Chrysoparadoxa australica]